MIRHGDCLAVLPTLEAGSVDAIVTDPPYGLGFMGKAWDHGVPGVPFWEAAVRVAKPGAHLLAFGGTRTYHRLACAVEDAGWEIRDCLNWLYGSGFPKSHNGPWGGTALKPAWEPIVLARKPLVGTVAANVAAHRTGALNIDGCRIAGVKGVPASVSNAGHLGWSTGGGMDRKREQNGRWPANVALDPEAADMLDKQSGESQSPPVGAMGGGSNRKAVYGDFAGVRNENGYGDRGGASRFFYCAKASRAEREEGLEGRDRKAKLWSSGEQSPGTFQAEGTDRTSTNHHPTVKPVALMRWLCRLVTPTGGLILDPFAGSGTTGIAAALEGFRFLGVELNEEYAAIARARIAKAAEQPSLWSTQPPRPTDHGGEG